MQKKQKIKTAYNFGNNVRLASLYFRKHSKSLDYTELRLKNENSILSSSHPLKYGRSTLLLF